MNVSCIHSWTHLSFQYATLFNSRSQSNRLRLNSYWYTTAVHLLTLRWGTVGIGFKIMSSIVSGWQNGCLDRVPNAGVKGATDFFRPNRFEIIPLNPLVSSDRLLLIHSRPVTMRSVVELLTGGEARWTKVLARRAFAFRGSCQG